MNLTAAELTLARETYAKGSTDQEWALFCADCKRYGITPLDKKLHFQVRKSKDKDGNWLRKYAPVTSIDYMREVADATGRYAGRDKATYTVYDDDKTYPVSAEVTIYKLVGAAITEVRYGYTAEAYWAEFYPGEGPNGAMWRKMPRLMLAKCAEALALRMGFPGQLQGLYEKAEMDQAESVSGLERGPDTSKSPVLSRPKTAGVATATLTRDERNEVLSAANLLGWGEADLSAFLYKHYGCTAVSAIPRSEYAGVMADVGKGPNAAFDFNGGN